MCDHLKKEAKCTKCGSYFEIDVNLRRPTCYDCNPIIETKKELFAEGLKICATCREIKSLDCFCSHKSKRDGFCSNCRSCVRNNKVKTCKRCGETKTGDHSLVCNTCLDKKLEADVFCPKCCEFKHVDTFEIGRKGNPYKVCGQCRTKEKIQKKKEKQLEMERNGVHIPKSREDCRVEHIENSKKYVYRRDFELGDKSSYYWCLKNRIDIIKTMKLKRKRWDRRSLIDFSKSCSHYADFASDANKVIRSKELGIWEDICSILPDPKKINLSKKQCLDITLKYGKQHEFKNDNLRLFNYISRKGWRDPCFNHFPDEYFKPYSYELFNEACIRNNEGYGILYFIRCWDSEESFYKIGITSLSVGDRYASEGAMPYEYEVIYEICVPSQSALDLENYVKSNFKTLMYRPHTHFEGSVLECFCEDLHLDMLFECQP